MHPKGPRTSANSSYNSLGLKVDISEITFSRELTTCEVYKMIWGVSNNEVHFILQVIDDIHNKELYNGVEEREWDSPFALAKLVKGSIVSTKGESNGETLGGLTRLGLKGGSGEFYISKYRHCL
jgi:hypothetical protein